MSTPVFARVLVGWDGSRAAATGLRLGCALTSFNGGKVTALAVVPTFHVETDAERKAAADAVRAELQHEYDGVLSRIQIQPGQTVSLQFVEDMHVAAALDAFADQELTDLLIVGLHGRDGALHPKMGHIANHVVTSSHCPVLVVPEAPAGGAPTAGHSPNVADAIKGLFHPGRHHAEV